MKLNLEGLTQEQLNIIKKQIEEFEKKNEKPEDKIDYENGWFVDMGKTHKISGIYNNYAYDIYSLGLYRDTKEECEKLIEKMKIEHRLKQWAKLCKEKIDWRFEDEKTKYYIYCYDKKIYIDFSTLRNENHIYFTDRLILEKAITDIGEQKLIDEYFVDVS